MAEQTVRAAGLMLACAISWMPMNSQAGDAPSALAKAAEHANNVEEAADPRFAPVEALLDKELARHKVPGASIAIVRAGELVYAHGFGYADREAQELVCADSRFRIASLAKPLTACAVLRLVEAGKLDLDDRAAPLLAEAALLPSDALEKDPRLGEITIRHLLQHRAGWDRAASGDPMFRSIAIAEALDKNPPASQTDTIRYTLSKPLDFTPGERYCYSNFGYCLLGRIIESASGQDYESYVRNEVLAPIGVTDIQIGTTLAQFRQEREVRYYDSGVGRSVFDSSNKNMVAQPYGAWNLEAMDAHGGWIASAPDLARFASEYYGDAESSRLSVASFDATISRPNDTAGNNDGGDPPQEHYGLGWQILTDETGKYTRMVHLGSLPGTSSLLVCQADGMCYALLCNSRQSPFSTHFCGTILKDLVRAIEEVQWPASP